ncbi:MAG: NAD(P)-binding domain-containing protein [Anaerolineae bacterium]|nr:NAD(P)-binding domain-containing protein [Anaerolineae bacterium]
MTMIYREPDADLALLMPRTLAVLGYGHMGRAFALNLRDSAFSVLIGNRDDEYAERAYHEGFEVTSLTDATARADLLFLTLPDEIAPQVYLQDIALNLRVGDTLAFASGYNIAFGFIEPPPFVDVVLVAPQALGSRVRESYVDGPGFPSIVGVAQDASGEAWPRVLALAKALGALRQGAVELTFQQEAELDLFTHQAILPAVFAILQTAVEVLNREGFPPEAVSMSLYLSGELGDLLSRWGEQGVLPTLKQHSRTAEYGMLSRLERFREVKHHRQMESVLDAIRHGAFAQEWAAEFADGYPRLETLRRQIAGSVIVRQEERALHALRPGVESTPAAPE